MHKGLKEIAADRFVNEAIAKGHAGAYEVNLRPGSKVTPERIRVAASRANLIHQTMPSKTGICIMLGKRKAA